jgi:hypothetical protein
MFVTVFLTVNSFPQGLGLHHINQGYRAMTAQHCPHSTLGYEKEGGGVIMICKCNKEKAESAVTLTPPLLTVVELQLLQLHSGV